MHRVPSINQPGYGFLPRYLSIRSISSQTPLRHAIHSQHIIPGICAFTTCLHNIGWSVPPNYHSSWRPHAIHTRTLSHLKRKPSLQAPKEGDCWIPESTTDFRTQSPWSKSHGASAQLLPLPSVHEMTLRTPPVHPFSISVIFTTTCETLSRAQLRCLLLWRAHSGRRSLDASWFVFGEC